MIEPASFALQLDGASAAVAAGALALAPVAASGNVADARILDGVCYGVIVGMMIYALMMYLTFRDRMYVYFMLATAWSIWTLAILNGHFSSWLLSDAQGLAERAAGAVMALWLAFAALFGWRFLKLRRDSPRIGRLVLALAALAVPAALAALAGALSLASQAVFALAAAGLVLLPLGTRASPRHGFRFRGWYLAATLTIFISLLLITGIRVGLLAPALVSGRAIQLFIVAQAILYSLALGLRLPRLWSQQGELHSQATELAKAAQTDPLTAVANRAGLAIRARAALDAGALGALLIIDLDHFKPINDEFGHDAGDEVLIRIARRLARITTLQDTVARLGGDEFAILLAGPRTRADLAGFAECVLQTIRAPIQSRGRVHQVGASLGVARFPQDGKDLSHLLRRADKALYRVKRQGRDGYSFFDELLPSASASGRF